MDVLRIEGKLMKTIVSKLVKTAIAKKTGYKVDIQINSLSINVADEKTNIHVNADAQINNNEFKKFVRLIESEEEL